LRRLAALLSHPKVVAVGEIGLDYHYDFSPRERQRAVFAEQLRIAREAGKPVSIHTREAWEDTLALLAAHWPAEGPGGILHCFTGGAEQARQCLEMGFHISFAGVVTFPNATEVQEAARQVPADRLLLETDAPYLAPVPRRGRRNEPALLVHVAEKLAALRGVTPETVAEAATANFRRLCLPGVPATE